MIYLIILLKIKTKIIKNIVFAGVLLLWGIVGLLNIVGASSSADFMIENQSVSSISNSLSSSDFVLQGGVTPIENNSSSPDFQLNSINIIDETVVSTICGNNIIEAGELCEKNNFRGLACSDFGFIYGDLQCQNCQIITTNCYNSSSSGGGGYYSPIWEEEDDHGNEANEESDEDQSQEEDHSENNEQNGAQDNSQPQEDQSQDEESEEGEVLGESDYNEDLHPAASNYEEISDDQEIFNQVDLEKSQLMDLLQQKENMLKQYQLIEKNIDQEIFVKNKEYKYAKQEECLYKQSWCLFMLLLIIVLLFLLLFKCIKNSKIRITYILIIIIILMGVFGFIKYMKAADDTTPNFIIYSGRLLDSAGDPIVSAHDFRFSFWKSDDYVGSDLTGSGSIDITAPNYSLWQEEQTIIPNSNGSFDAELGSVIPLPILDFDLHKFLQIEIKSQGAPDTDYQLMDPTGDSGLDTTDRQSIGSVPYAKNTERIDNREIGTGSGNLALLGSGGVWPTALISGGTDADQFIIDNDDTVLGEIKLIFGETINKYLSYDQIQAYFLFNDNVRIGGDLTVDGVIMLGGSGGKLIFSNSGLTSDRMIMFDDADTKVVGEDNVQILTNKTIDGTQNTFSNIDFSSLNTRLKSLIIVPEFDQFFVTEDGSSNIGSLRQGYDNLNQQPYYIFSSAENILQDLDIILNIEIPDDFVSWDIIPIQIKLLSSSTNINDNQIDIILKDTNNNVVAIVGASDLVGSVNNIWEQKNLTFSGASIFTPGEIITMEFKMQTKTPDTISVGEVRLNYYGK